jgi:hypothetical protein
MLFRYFFASHIEYLFKTTEGQKVQLHPFFNFTDGEGKKTELCVGDDRNMYINGKKIVTESKLELSWWVNVAAVLAGLGAISSFLLELLKTLKWIGG